ncbi:MAG: DUF494 domain-containing protein [Gammaproteobacteria bacterium]|nr:DUF494 domain-containing protein [Gammaproteobacteria bacterium]
MKQNVIDVLMYLLEFYSDDTSIFDGDRLTIETELVAAGFPDTEVGKAFDWLESLTDLPEQESNLANRSKSGSTRVFTAAEQQRLSPACQGFLHFIAHSEVIDWASLEVVIDRVLALDTQDIDLEQIKWVVLMVMFNQPGKESTYAWLEELVYENEHRVH